MRWVRLSAKWTLVVVATLFVWELLLQAASLFSELRAEDTSAPRRVLCLGDSHTFGVLVEEDESYPAQLQQQLQKQAPGQYGVINLGVPGMSSSQVREALPLHVAKYAPHVVVVWIGVNDAWKRGERDASGMTAWQRLDAIATRSRLYTTLRVWRHDRNLERAVAELRDDGRHQEAEFRRWREPDGGRGTKWILRYDGAIHEIENRKSEATEATPELQRHTRQELQRIASWLEDAGIPLVLIRYPLEVWSFATANRAIDEVERELGVSVVDAAAALRRVPEDQVEWLRGAHPNAPVYAELAADLAPLVLKLSTN